MNPFLINEPTCISFSGGRSSAYLLWRVLQENNGLPEQAIVTFANTGKESEESLMFVRDVQENWGVKIDWVEYRPEGIALVTYESASRNGEPFEMLINKKNYLPNPVTRFCTQELKVNAISKYVGMFFDEFDTMVGVRADERSRLPRLRSRGLRVPLADANVTQIDVQEFWKQQQFDLNLKHADGVTALGNCDLCFLKGPRQKMSVIRQQPERAIWWAAMEKRVGATFCKDSPSYSRMLQIAQSQDDLFGYPDDSISCFCGD